ncbi:MAG: hypothetical protein A2X52_12110 [Candidatus Rokubacteria bacterium GWC2_70_16]|nr:MAG: hypothetical protein A2X52_12110 [Candidatus Rokubacteria bacterium GWC2_70_16]
MQDISRRLAEYVAGTRFEDLSIEAVASARRSTLDTLGCMAAGSSAPGIGTLVELARGWGGREEATVVGFGHRVPAPVAVWCNGSMARALEIDDCVDFLPVHPSASAVPALLAVSELRGGLSGRDFLTALAVGQDVKIRMGLAVRQNAMESGRNNLFKIFGPAAAVARALGLDPDRTQHALGIAFSHAVGDGQCALDGALSLRLQQGIVAQGALLSGLLAERGFTGARDFLLGKYGYLRAFEPEPRLEYLLEGLGRRFYGEQITLKPYSSCRATHAAIELALRWREEAGGKLDGLRAVTVRVTPEVDRLVGSPREARLRPDSAPGAQFSLLYTVAAALARGRVFLDEIAPEAYTSETILQLAERVRVEPDPAMRTDLVVGRTEVTIEAEGQPPWRQAVEHPLGGARRPLSPEACREKFLAAGAHCVRPLDPARLKQIVEMTARLEALDDVSHLARLLGG